MDTRFFTRTILLAIAICLTVHGTPGQTATVGCPFEDTSCQKYCAEQGCNLGYCGNFAWIQCICRKCGHEWNSYDKLRLNPGAQVNQAELDSLKLNGTTTPSSQIQQIPTASSTDAPQPEVSTVDMVENPKPDAQENTLTLLLVPDLSSDNDNLDQNEIPDENSEKFLDYLVDNHAKLVQATLARASQSLSSEEGSQPEEELIEIQLSSNNNTKPTGADTLQSSTPLHNLLRPEAKTNDRSAPSGAN